MEDDKLDFGDLDEFDTQEGGNLNDSIEDFDELERELGLADDAVNSTSESTTELLQSSTEKDKSTNKTDSGTTTTTTLAKSTTSTASSAGNQRPNRNTTFSNRNGSVRHQHNGYRYSPYPQHFPNMTYPNLTSFNGVSLPGTNMYGQGYMNMPLPGVMGMPMMGYNNNMVTGSPQTRRIHVNPNFKGARPPQLSGSGNDEVARKEEQQRVVEELRKEQAQRDKDSIAKELRKQRFQSHDDQKQERKRPLDNDQDTATTVQRRKLNPSATPFSPKDSGKYPSNQGMDDAGNRNSPQQEVNSRNTGGFSIRGAAMAAATTTSSQQTLRQDQRRSNTPGDKVSFVKNSSILQRLRHQPTKEEPSNDAPPTPIFANGKSSKLIVSNISSEVTESTLNSLEPKDIKSVTLNQKDKTAILLFGAIDPAVNFRRKHNRALVGGQHISISFAKN
ncbi:uncharacterized protein BX664DRAFT_342784 [Halteromyces radiatus]|uniref:uncharacterized protein n=1 Tax=Halteromyces radiatus TaxID=101107 RepID=UPI002221279C|nr:uncharacterized protein BX664DRAFT_342784 [Halteromyces radiatus]KAI8078821.1 hypothetical protein BX664DRAFT_342784 [Halteromyces radiatus]